MSELMNLAANLATLGPDKEINYNERMDRGAGQWSHTRRVNSRHCGTAIRRPIAG